LNIQNWFLCIKYLDNEFDPIVVGTRSQQEKNYQKLIKIITAPDVVFRRCKMQ
jgi:hypothetical protein